MMAWSTVRKATTEDQERWQSVVDRFGTRHNVLAENVLMLNDDGTLGSGSLLDATDGGHYSPERALKLRGYLRRNIRRAIGGEGIAYGYIGNHVD